MTSSHLCPMELMDRIGTIVDSSFAHLCTASQGKGGEFARKPLVALFPEA